MTFFLPVFPLELVVYPGEKLNLHIFEPRYRQLINECREKNTAFGIPAVINKKPADFGTIVQLKEVAKEYEDGRMDIKTEGQSVFKVLEYVKEIPDKLYSGAIVTPVQIGRAHV